LKTLSGTIGCVNESVSRCDFFPTFCHISAFGIFYKEVRRLFEAYGIHVTTAILEQSQGPKVLKAIDPYSFFSRNAKEEQVHAIPGLCCFMVRDLSCLLATLVTISSAWIQV
jgi:hypothetical protein